jgi:non-ribosomal peptide synthetase component F
VQPFELSTQLAAGLRELSRQEQVPLRTTLTAALAALLYRYTGQQDLLIGTIPERGPGPLAQPMMGCFPNTVVHRANLAGEPATRELLRRTQAASQDILPHQNVPFDAVVKELKPEHTAGRPPLVQVALAVAPAVATAPAYPPVSSSAWELTPVGLDAPAPKFDLLVEAEERTEGLAGRFVFHRGLYEPETIRRMAGHWQLVLEQMVAAPERPVTELELLTGPERAQLLEQWSAGGAVPAGPDVAELIEAQARKSPAAMAVVCGSEQLSFGDLDARAGQLARYLQQHGVGPGVAVGVCLERSPEQVIALLAIFRAGGVYVPLDPATPAERIRYVVQDTGMPLLLTQAWHLEQVGGSGTQVVCLDADEAAMVQAGEQQQPEQVSRDGQAAYIIYTSGSTGQP